MDGKIEVGCEVYRYGERIIEVVDNTVYANIGDGNSLFEKTSQSLRARKKNDYNFTISGVVNVINNREL